MKILTEKLEESGKDYFSLAQKVSKNSGCLRRKCGTVIIKGGKIIGKGFNSPALNDEKYRRCLEDKSSLDEKVTDKTCCPHAEQRAMMDALKKGYDLTGSSIYFTSVDENGDRLKSGEPYCTHCSKMALDLGVGTWFLEKEEGTVMYDSSEYHEISYKYHR